MTSEQFQPAVSLRPASKDEAEFLTELALRSKGYWQYEAAFLRECRADLTITPEYISSNTVVVAERCAIPVAFYSLARLTETEIELVHLFVEPREIGHGYGKRLFLDAVQVSRVLGYQSILIRSDPYAEGFYRAMGAMRVGEVESAILRGRSLPLLRFNLSVIL